jgi:hypothetical protein
MSACDILNFFKLDSKDSEFLDQIAVKIRRKYVEFLADLGEGQEKNPYWWTLNFVSRNTLISPLFKNLCLLTLLKSKIDKGKIPNKIILGSLGMKKLLDNYKRDNNYNFDIDYRGKNNFFIVLQRFFNFIKVALNLFLRWFFSIEIYNKVKETFHEDIVLLDIFIFRDSIENDVFKDRYYPGLLDYVSLKEKRKLFYLPSFYDIWNYGKFFKKVRQSAFNFILKEEYLKLVDYIKALKLPFEMRFSITKKIFEGFDISKLIDEEILNDRVSNSSINGILNYLFVNRLNEKNVRVKTFINWFENQAIDHGYNIGFQEFYKDSNLHGYLGTPLQNNYLSIYPTEQERINKVIPKDIFVIGNGYTGKVKEFCRKLSVTVAPAFRYTGLWKDRNFYPDNYKYTILIALPILLDESDMMIEMSNSMAKEIKIENCCFQIKPHPAQNTVKLKKKWSQKLLPNFSFISGDFNSCIEKADVLISAASSSCLEAVAKGIPVIVIGSRIGLTQRVIPESINKDIWRLCYDKDSLKKAVIFFNSRKKDGLKHFLKIGEEIKKKYFHPISRDDVRKLLGL